MKYLDLTLNILLHKFRSFARKTDWPDGSPKLHISVELYNSNIIVEGPGERFMYLAI